MKEYYNYHSFEIRRNKFSLFDIEIHREEQRSDDMRLGIKETFLFNGFTICFIIFELVIGVKIYETI